MKKEGPGDPCLRQDRGFPFICVGVQLNFFVPGGTQPEMSLNAHGAGPLAL